MAVGKRKIPLAERVSAKLRNQEVRVWLYGLAALLVGYLMATGQVSLTDHEFILSTLAFVLGVERVNARTTPAPPKSGTPSDGDATSA